MLKFPKNIALDQQMGMLDKKIPALINLVSKLFFNSLYLTHSIFIQQLK